MDVSPKISIKQECIDNETNTAEFDFVCVKEEHCLIESEEEHMPAIKEEIDTLEKIENVNNHVVSKEINFIKCDQELPFNCDINAVDPLLLTHDDVVNMKDDNKELTTSLLLQEEVLHSVEKSDSISYEHHDSVTDTSDRRDIHNKGKNQQYSRREHLKTSPGSKSYKCSTCNYSTVKKSNLARHMRQHSGDKPFSCSQCSYSTVHKSDLVIHTRTHSGEKPFSCVLCNYSAIRKADLVIHMRTHSGQKPFRCSLCDYSAVHQSNLVIHMKTHSGEKPFSCAQCNYSAVRKSHLVRHMRTHSGDKPFSCTLCDYSAGDKSSLVRHMRVHSGEKPFSCSQCNYSAVQKFNLVIHMRTHSGQKP